MIDAARDQEFVDVFVEEAEEVLGNIDNNLPAWKKNPRDKSALTDIRRAFHTLKGSGRMVNALELAEVAWKIEGMLNRALDGSVPVSESMVGLVGDGRKLMPRMISAFKEHRSMDSDSDVEALMLRADALASGKSTTSTPAATPKPQAARPTAVSGSGADANMRVKIFELNRRLERTGSRSDEALHRSEMALQLARRSAQALKGLERDADERLSRNDLGRVTERVNAMTKEVLELRRESQQAASERNVPTAQDVNQMIDIRLRERLEHVERRRVELERRLEASEKSLSSARRVSMVALAVSMLVGAVFAGLILASTGLG